MRSNYNQPQPPFNPNNPIFGQQFGGYQNFMNQFQAFSQQFNQSAQLTPQQIIQQKIQNGLISQEQFNTIAQMANSIMGIR